MSALLLGDLYYTQLSLSGVSDHLSHSALQELYEMLHANLSSNISKVGQTDPQQMRIDLLPSLMHQSFPCKEIETPLLSLK